MKWLAACVIATLLTSADALAAEIALIPENNQLGIVITGLQFPNTLTKDLTSGLTNRIFVRVSVTSNAQPLVKKTVNIAIKYDLWEEAFQLTLQDGDAQLATYRFSNVQQLMEFLERLRLTNILPLHHSPANQECVVQAEVLINPIDRERMDRVRKWVADNSAYLPSNQPGSALENSVGSRPNELFNKIFEQYAEGVDLASAWKATVTSKPFKLENLGDAK